MIGSQRTTTRFTVGVVLATCLTVAAVHAAPPTTATHRDDPTVTPTAGVRPSPSKLGSSSNAWFAFLPQHGAATEDRPSRATVLAIDRASEVRRARVPAPAPARVTVAVTGDILPHQPVLDAARRSDGTFDFRPLLAGIRRPIAAADLALCHLEVPLTADRTRLSTYPRFNAPTELAAALADIGYDGCSVASNHAFDRGTPGVRATLEALDAAGLGHAGTARTRRESRRVRIYDVPPARIAHLSYTYGLNGMVLPTDRRWSVDLIERRRILADAGRARRAGANVVIVSLHWGQEYVSTPTPQQDRLARRLLRAPQVDVLVGHHAHVVQPVARRRGKVVVFGMGNLLSNQTAACCVAGTQDGVIVRLVLQPRGDGSFAVRRVTYLPTVVRHPDRRVVLVHRALAGGAHGDWRRQLRASLQRTRRAIGDDATLERGG